MKESAVVPANHKFMTPKGKTAHGLVRGSDRFRTEYREKLGIPVVEPLTEGVEALAPAVRSFIERERTRGAALVESAAARSKTRRAR